MRIKEFREVIFVRTCEEQSLPVGTQGIPNEYPNYYKNLIAE